MDSRAGRRLIVEGRSLVDFASNDYLGLAADPRVVAALRAGAERWGAGAGASHLVTGHTAEHAALEEEVAAFTGRERALVFSSGYAANVATINALAGRRDLVFGDRLNHASLIDGARQSGAQLEWYPHVDVHALEQVLLRHVGSPGRRLVVTDGTFSMDGDVCPLGDLVELARRHRAWLMVDDAHGIGVHGRAGTGVVDSQVHGSGDVPVLVGTFGKAFGTAGAFVAGDTALIDFLVQRARNYVYSTALPPALAAATRAALDIAQAEGWRREALAGLVERFRDGAASRDIRLLPSATPIQPVVLGTAGRTMRVAAMLEDRGYLVGAIRPPTVPEGTARLRITLGAGHEPADVDGLLDALGDTLRDTVPETVTEQVR